MGNSLDKAKNVLLNVLSKYGDLPGYDLPYMHFSCHNENVFVCTLKCTDVEKESIRRVSWNPYTFSFKNEFLPTSCYRKQLVLKKDFTSSKSVWPVSFVDRIFLPEFRMKRSFTDHDFTIISQISKGAFGKVYKVKDVKTEKMYAMKTLQKCQVIQENAIRQVKDEASIQKMCGHHEFIVNCLFSWQTHPLLFIVTEYKSRGDLFQLLEKYIFLSEDVVKLYVAEIAIAIGFLHNAGVIYRDLKPENVLLDEHYHISLTDFGLSKWLPIGSRTNTICGTFQYMAPEVCSGVPYSHAVDWWSLGVLACRLLTDEYPERRGSEIHLPDTVPMNVRTRDLLLRLLTYDPARRLHSLYTLKTIAFFKNYNFNDVVEKKINPRVLLDQCQTRAIENSIDMFTDFDTEN